MSEIKIVEIAHKDDDFWSRINDFLQKERDSIFASLTHVRIAMAASVIISVLLSATSFTSPLAKYLESSTERFNPLSATILASFGLSALLVLCLALMALRRLYRALKKSLMDELRNRAEAVETACKNANIEIPSKTKKILETFDYYERRS